MKQSISGVKSTSFERRDIKKFNFIPPTSVAQGTPNVSKLHFPVVGFDAIFEQTTGPIANSGTLLGLLEESSDDITYTTVKDTAGVDVALAVASAASDIQQRKVRITKAYVRYTATVSVSTGTVITAAGLVA